MEEDIKRIIKIFNNSETQKADKLVLYNTAIKDIVNVLERLQKENKDLKDENIFLKKIITKLHGLKIRDEGREKEYMRLNILKIKSNSIITKKERN